MTATIEDVARRAEVSVATVSRALRGLPNVAPSTRQRVLHAARELAYVADPSASRLASGRNHVIGLVVPMLGQWYYSRLFSGVEAIATPGGYDVLPFTLSGPGGVDRFVESTPFRKRVDGLLLADAPVDADQLAALVAVGVPLVTVGVMGPGVPGLTIDNVGAARRATEHLLALGHRRVGLIGGLEDDPFRFSVPLDRSRGYRDALLAHRIPHDPMLVVPGHFSLEGGAEAMRRLLALDEPPTAVFACSDEMAIGAIHVARAAGVRVPEELSVIGFDDHEVSRFVGLTTIRQDVLGQGERAARLLLERLRDGRCSVTHEIQPTELVLRATTAVVAGGCPAPPEALAGSAPGDDDAGGVG